MNNSDVKLHWYGRSQVLDQSFCKFSITRQRRRHHVDMLTKDDETCFNYQ